MRGMNGIDWEHGRRLWIQGKASREIAAAIGCNKSSVCRRAKSEGWERAEDVIGRVASGAVVAREDGGMALGNAERSAKCVKERIQADVDAVLEALAAIRPADLSLSQLATRERVAGDLLKRADAVFEIAEKEKAVVNIAVMSQLPDAVVAG